MRLVRAATLLVGAALCGGSARAAELFVDARGSDMNDGLSWLAPKATVTSALMVAAATPEADVVRVAEGVYRERIIVPPDTLLEGGWALGGGARDPRAYATVLDGMRGGCVVTLGPGTDGSALEGFVVRNGRADVAWPSAGGILLDRTAASVRDCIVESCAFVADTYGIPAAIMRFEGGGIVERCVIRGNISTGLIVAAFDLRPEPAMPFLRDCAVEGNRLLARVPGDGAETTPSVVRIDTRATATAGPIVERTLIAHNALADGPGYQWYRGARARCAGLYLNAELCRLEVRDSILAGNDDTGVVMGELYYGSGSRLVNCLIAGNRRIGVHLGCRKNPPDEFVNCTIVDNPHPVASLNPTLAGYDGYGIFSRSIVLGGIPLDSPERVNECTPLYDGSDSIIEGGLPMLPGTNILDIDPLLVPGPLHDAYLAQVACGDAADSPALDSGPELAADVGLADPYSTCRRDSPDTGAADWGFHASGLGYALFPDGAIGVPLRIFRGTRPDVLAEVASVDDLPWLDAPGVLDAPALPLLFYSVETVLNDVRALPDEAIRSVRLTW